jgi:hypothetical protein
VGVVGGASTSSDSRAFAVAWFCLLPASAAVPASAALKSSRAWTKSPLA